MSAIDLFAAFATDEKAEADGILTLVPKCGDTMFRIARTNNDNYNQLLQKLVKQNRVALDSKGKIAKETNEKIFVELFAKTILLGWEGTINFQGKQLAYSFEHAVALLKHKAFRDAISQVADDMDNFKAVKEAEDAKN